MKKLFLISTLMLALVSCSSPVVDEENVSSDSTTVVVVDSTVGVSATTGVKVVDTDKVEVGTVK